MTTGAPPGGWLAATPDLRQPWLAPYAAEGDALLAEVARGASAAQALAARPVPIELATGPLCFVPPDSAPAGEAYEAFIARSASVPTRDNLHDLFNGLVWLHFPQTKRRLNSWQAEEIARRGTGATRGPLRDALTLFDENGAVLVDASPALREALQRRDWRALFVTHRADWQAAQLVVFGHALLEKLVRAPRKALTAHVLFAPPNAGAGLPALDRALAASLSREALAAKPFSPMPVMGIPLWSAENQNNSFYDDPDVFRPAGRRKNQEHSKASLPARPA